MPANTPLTASPYPLLADAPNIETAVQPGLKHLEKYVIPRFSSTSERNAAFAIVPPDLGQLVYVVSLGHLGYTVWNGSAWEEFGLYTRTRRSVARVENDQTRTSTLFSNVAGLALLVTEGVWKVELFLLYSTEQVGTNIEINFTFPGATSTMSFGLMGRGRNSTGGNSDADELATDAAGSRLSGDIVGLHLGGIGNSDALYGRGDGVLLSDAAGLLQVTYGREGDTGEVTVRAGTLLSIQRIS